MTIRAIRLRGRVVAAAINAVINEEISGVVNVGTSRGTREAAHRARTIGISEGINREISGAISVVTSAATGSPALFKDARNISRNVRHKARCKASRWVNPPASPATRGSRPAGCRAKVGRVEAAAVVVVVVAVVGGGAIVIARISSKIRTSRIKTDSLARSRRARKKWVRLHLMEARKVNKEFWKLTRGMSLIKTRVTIRGRRIGDQLWRT